MQGGSMREADSGSDVKAFAVARDVTGRNRVAYG
jgi:hypothetical protein